MQITKHKVHDLQVAQQQIANAQQQIAALQSSTLAEHRALLQAPLAQLLVAQQRIELKLDSIEAGHAGSFMETELGAIANSVFSPRSLPEGTAASSSILIKTTVTRQPCMHRLRQTKKRSPQSLSRFLGTLFVGYSGSPETCERCAAESYGRRSQSGSTILITYFFPRWLIARALMIALRLSSAYGPELVVRVPRVVSNYSRIFVCAKNGDADGVKDILQKGHGSPMDIDVVTGMTALDV